MPSNCFFLDEPFHEGSLVSLGDEEVHHAKGVSRVREGEEVSLFNGKGSVAKALIHSIERKKIVLLVESVEIVPPPNKKLVMGISLLRPGHLDFVIEKGTELGVEKFILFPADLSDRRECSQELKRRLNALLIAALKQSGGLFLPKVCYASSLEEALSFADKPLVWADIAEDSRPLGEALSDVEERTCLSLFIGPESGWTEKERKSFRCYGPPIWLHDTILRAETAGIIGAYTGFCWLRGLDSRGYRSS